MQRVGIGIAVGLGLVLLAACPGGDDGDSGGVTGNSGPSSASNASNVSNEDGPEPATCEQLGGVCSCAGSCEEGQMSAPSGTCPQPPDESGACGQECCVPTAATTASSTAGTASSADSAAETSPPVCDCAVLPVCNTPEGEDCSGQYPEAHCCDDQGEAMTCSCIEPCDGGFPCCNLQPECT